MKRFILGVGLVTLACLVGVAQEKSSGSEFVGTWSGTWQLDQQSGGFELTLEKGDGGSIKGRVSVTGEPTYKATLKTAAFDGKKMTASYDFPPDDQLEIVLAITFDGNKANGPWTARAKASGSDVATGPLILEKK
jgi:hypothetical protein